ncbi:MAG TPA: hypothetical protein VNZ45_05355, partial [Bacteroidia bacterium]|nr:hypothetical protein [Bacteroidia bacterium]
MALNIPLPGVPGDTFGKALDSGGNLFSQIMNPILEREKQKQLEEHFQAQLGLSKAAAGRAAQAASDAHRLAMMKLDPKYAINQLKQKLEFINSLGVGQDDQQNTQQSAEQQYPDLHKMFMGQGVFPEGTIETGNLDLSNRPQVPNPDIGTFPLSNPKTSTVLSMSIGTPEGEVLIPRVSDDGRILTPEQAKEQFKRTGKHMGIYSSPDEATRAAKSIHEDQAKMISPKSQ